MTTRAGYVIAPPAKLGEPSPLLCDNIDPTTHDFASLTTTIDPIDAQVILALKVRRASGASVMEDGNRLHTVVKMDDSAQSEIRSLIKEALSRLIGNFDIQYRGVTFPDWSPSNQFCTLIVQWINLRAKDRDVREHPLIIQRL